MMIITWQNHVKMNCRKATPQKNGALAEKGEERKKYL